MGDACSRCGGRVAGPDDVLLKVMSKTSGGYFHLDVCLQCLVAWKKAEIMKSLKTEIEAVVDDRIKAKLFGGGGSA